MYTKGTIKMLSDDIDREDTYQRKCNELDKLINRAEVKFYEDGMLKSTVSIPASLILPQVRDYYRGLLADVRESINSTVIIRTDKL